MRVTKRQLDLLIREALSTPDHMLLTEEELNEIAPFITSLVGALGRGTAKRFGDLAKAGIEKAGEWIKDNPEQVEKIMGMLQQTAEKLPGVQKAVEQIGDDPAKAVQLLQNPPEEMKSDLDTMFKNAGEQLEKEEECECPTPDETEGVMDKLGKFFS